CGEQIVDQYLPERRSHEGEPDGTCSSLLSLHSFCKSSECLFAHRRDDGRIRLLGLTQRLRRPTTAGEAADHSRSSAHRRRFPSRSDGTGGRLPANRGQVPEEVRKEKYVTATVAATSTSIRAQDGHLSC
ncbi:hypothetical protein PMAYCL1PPCAC_21505, partial [Pristionchus mayeri]